MKTAIPLIIAIMIGMHAFITVAPVSAGEGFDREKFRAKKQEMMNSIFEELHLSEDQQERIKKNRDMVREEQTELRSMIKEKRAALKTEFEKGNASKEAIDRITNELVELDAQKTRNRVEGIWAVKSILTPEQFKTFQEKKEQFKNGRKHKFIKGEKS